MGYYDSSSEDYDERRLREKAEALGITTYEYVALERHNYNMKEGEKLFKQRKVDEELIAYYLSNCEEVEDV